MLQGRGSEVLRRVQGIPQPPEDPRGPRVAVAKAAPEPSRDRQQRQLQEVQERLLLLEGGLEQVQQNANDLRQRAGIFSDDPPAPAAPLAAPSAEPPAPVGLESYPKRIIVSSDAFCSSPVAPPTFLETPRTAASWRCLLDRRFASLAVVKMSKEYLSPWNITKTPAPVAPDAHDRSCTWQQWEKRMDGWKAALAARTQQPEPGELWQAGWLADWL